MLYFENDYSEGAHEAVLRRLAETNRIHAPGYGSDPFTAAARDKIRSACAAPDADVFFIAGGTQTNQLTIDTMLAPYEGVIAAETGHINGHEAGAVEFTGHKVLALPQRLGKFTAADLRARVEGFYADANHEHGVFPGMVYLSYPTEYGTLYTKEELTAISAVCREFRLPLFLDGARLGYGLAGTDDMTLPDIARLCDVFYIGGTKVGALCGEALVFPNPAVTPAHFLTRIKQHGALLAKGRLIAVQFDALFTDGLYFRISRHAVELAMKLRAVLQEKGIPFFLDSPTNQQFVVLENGRLETLRREVRYGFWEVYDETHTVVRFATSWATEAEDIDALAALL